MILANRVIYFISQDRRNKQRYIESDTLNTIRIVRKMTQDESMSCDLFVHSMINVCLTSF